MTQADEERRLLKAEALISEFGDEPEVVRLSRAVAALFLATCTADGAGRVRLDLDVVLGGLAVGVSEFVRATRGPQYGVDVHGTRDGETFGIYRGAPPPPRVH